MPRDPQLITPARAAALRDQPFVINNRGSGKVLYPDEASQTRARLFLEPYRAEEEARGLDFQHWYIGDDAHERGLPIRNWQSGLYLGGANGQVWQTETEVRWDILEGEAGVFRLRFRWAAADHAIPFERQRPVSGAYLSQNGDYDADMRVPNFPNYFD